MSDTLLSREQVEALRPLAKLEALMVYLDEQRSSLGVHNALAVMIDQDAALRAEVEGYKVALAERLEEIVRVKQDLEAEQLNVWPAPPRQSKEELRAENERLKSEWAEGAALYGADYARLEAENELLKGELIAWKHSAISADAQEAELNELTAQVTALEQDKADSQTANAALREGLEQCRADYRSEQRMSEDLEQQLAASEQRCDMLARELASLKAGVGWPQKG